MCNSILDDWEAVVKCRAAVLRGVGQDWEVCEVDIDEPAAGEVLVRMVAASVCHTDDHFATGDCVPSPEMADMMLRSVVSEYHSNGLVLRLVQLVRVVKRQEHSEDALDLVV